MEIERRITADVALEDLLRNYGDALQRVEALDGQIERSERADAVRRILDDVRSAEGYQKKEFFVRFMGNGINIYPAIEFIQKVGAAYVDVIKTVMGR